MRLRIIFPSSRAGYTDLEVERRNAALTRHCGPETQLEFAYPPAGGTFKMGLTIEDFEPMIPQFVEGARAAERDGCDAFMIHCVYDPGIELARAAVKIPVVGFGESTFQAAVQIAPKFGLITPNDALTETALKLLERIGLRDRLVHAEPLNIELPEAHKRLDELKRRGVGIAQRAREHGAGVVIPFGLALVPAHLTTEDIRDGAGIPVLNPAQIGIRHAELIMAALQ